MKLNYKDYKGIKYGPMYSVGKIENTLVFEILTGFGSIPEYHEISKKEFDSFGSWSKERLLVYTDVLFSDTPTNAAILMKNAIDSKNYEGFNKLFSEDRKGIITEKDFNELNKVSTAGSDHKLYTTISFTNGEMLLIKLNTEKINGEYKIEDVVQVPDEMKSFFEDKE